MSENIEDSTKIKDKRIIAMAEEKPVKAVGSYLEVKVQQPIP